MIQIGKRDGDGKKIQLFVDSPRQRLGFDLNNKDTHPAGMLAEVTATFKDAVTIIKPVSSTKIQKKKPKTIS